MDYQVVPHPVFLQGPPEQTLGNVNEWWFVNS